MRRVLSIDILRGFDLFMLLIFGPIVMGVCRIEALREPLSGLATQFGHVRWEGLAMWDMVMPLFMFTVGLAIPFSFDKFKTGSKQIDAKVYLEILKRVGLLWLLGMVVQGNLLSLDPSNFKVFSNTLQAIAVGYLGAAILYLNLSIRWQIVATLGLLVGYWALMRFAGGDDYGMGSNLAERIDIWTLGAARDGAFIGDRGVIRQSDWYNYAWIMPSINFVATVASGVFAAVVIRQNWSEKRRVLLLFTLGLGELAVGYLWGVEMPIIKTIWTSSMVLVTSGYATLLFGVFYLVFDVLKYDKGFKWLTILGANSIAAYVIGSIISFSSVSKSLLHGFQHYIGDQWYGVMIIAANGAILFAILWFMKKQGIYVKV